MALPVIDSKVAEPSVIHECEASVITIVAHDPGATVEREVLLELRVANGAGEVTPDIVKVKVLGEGSGPLTYALTIVGTNPPGMPLGEIIPDPTRPGVFVYQAPCPDDPNHNPATHETLAGPHNH